MANIELKQVSKTYRDHDCVIRDVDLRIEEGEFCVFVGPSGCGKSTLLRMIAGLETISAGELLIDGVTMNEVPPASRGVAMVFQSYALFPHMTVFDNLAFGMRIAGARRDEIRSRVAKVAASLGLDALLMRKPRSLSGGQRQRVAIGRALVREPGVFLFDEPLSNLDAGLRAQTRLEIAKIHRDFGRASTVYVTHDQVEAMTLADRIVLLNSGDAVAREGSIAQAGAPLELYHRPRNLFVARFIGSPQMNLLPGVVIAGGAQTRVRLASGETLTAAVDGRTLSPGATVTLGVRAEDVGLGGAGQTLVRTVEWQERLGDTTYLYLAGYGDAPLVVRAPGRTHARRTQRIALQLPPYALHLFDQHGVALPREAPAQNGLIDDPGIS